MKYLKPEMEIVELEIDDVIRTSGKEIDNITNPINPNIPWD